MPRIHARSATLAFAEPLEERRLLAAMSYDFIGSSSWDPPPGTEYVSTGNYGDRHTMEPNVGAIPPTSGWMSGHASGASTGFSITGLPKHTELELHISAVGRLATPLPPVGPGEDPPEDEGDWRFDVDFGTHSRWWTSAGTAGGDPWHFLHYDDSLSVTITGTWLSGGVAPTWFLDRATVDRYTPTVYIQATDTAVEGQTEYPPGQEPGFMLTRAGDDMLGSLVVELSEATGTAGAGTDYSALPGSVIILVGESEKFVGLSTIDDQQREWTEFVEVLVAEGNHYEPGAPTYPRVHIWDDDDADIDAQGLPEELDDPDYNEAEPGLFLAVNDAMTTTACPTASSRAWRWARMIWRK